ncbi:unnamed protein product [Acanthoscelides obtectus]|uniref:Uncharacterized protein n=1 Tax=Acanthoscelides obtectus TaxID=200917 RepID=A0A9P0KXJ0_ACAOB|nr:unnamed protein product [Acanthoscelides obtectus]CAH2007307.1 unnamed protein product [Acanthoscelides obtectus]CAK1630437.1 hypothetical protein AOBTE_LOCUS6325 [Acanthoscelides obtectus]CAK1630523.1 hypothetical protein AOBTE_LOCUS6379 [Acanthoscelides obtectus]
MVLLDIAVIVLKVMTMTILEITLLLITMTRSTMKTLTVIIAVFMTVSLVTSRTFKIVRIILVFATKVVLGILRLFFGGKEPSGDYIDACVGSEDSESDIIDRKAVRASGDTDFRSDSEELES